MGLPEIVFEGSNAVNVLVILSITVPVIIVIILPFVFFRAARRNDEREALEKQALENVALERQASGEPPGT